MIRLLVRHSHDATYFTNDAAHELDSLRDGGPGWWMRGGGDTRDPSAVERVFTSTQRSKVVGYDLVVAAPRPISVLIALDPLQAPGVISAHRASVAASLNYLEQRAVVVRERRDGQDREEPARWERIVSFTHGLNRHGEPHLHDHVLVGARPQGSHRVLDSRALFAHAPTADALYRSSLRYELAQRTSWTAWRSFSGVEHVLGVDEGYRALWGGHHQGRGKKLSWQRAQTLEKWRSDLERFEPEGTMRAPRGDRNHLDEHSFSAQLEGRHDVTRRHVVAAWANAANFGQPTQHVSDTIDRLFPELRESRGVRELTVGVARARMTGQVRERGARPVHVSELSDWTQRSRERSGAWSERSR